MSSSGEADQPTANNNQRGADAETKHWLEYAIFVFVILTAIATGCAPWYMRQQWITADDSEKRDLRAYVYLDTETKKWPTDNPDRYAVALKITNGDLE